MNVKKDTFEFLFDKVLMMEKGFRTEPVMSRRNYL